MCQSSYRHLRAAKRGCTSGYGGRHRPGTAARHQPITGTGHRRMLHGARREENTREGGLHRPRRHRAEGLSAGPHHPPRRGTAPADPHARDTGPGRRHPPRACRPPPQGPGRAAGAGPLDAAFVHAPTDAHPDIVTRLLDAGVPTYVDKPLAYELADSRRLVELAERRGTSLAVGFSRRFAPAYAQCADHPRDLILLQKNRVGLPRTPAPSSSTTSSTSSTPCASCSRAPSSTRPSAPGCGTASCTTSCCSCPATASPPSAS